VWDLSHETRVVETTSQFGVKLIRLPSFARTVEHALRLPAQTRFFFKNVRPSVDLLHLHSVFRADNLWAASQVGGPYLLTPNGGYSHAVMHGRNRLLKLIWITLWERGLWSRASVLHAVSNQEAERLRSLGGVKAVAMIPNGVASSLLVAPQKEECAARYWLFLGRMAVQQKGLDLLLIAYALARKQRALPDLHLVGPDFHGGKAELANLATKLGIAQCIHLLEPVYGDAKHALLAGAELFLHPSRWDGMPFAVLEALALGTPALVTPGTGFAEILKDRRAGWACEATADALATAIVDVAHCTAAEMKSTSSRARALVREHFSWDAIARQMAELYRRTHKATMTGFR
jgi:glycosyltransferase involved in cell wall biosynthesis